MAKNDIKGQVKTANEFVMDYAVCETPGLSILDRLKSRRAKIASEKSRLLRDLDRQIDLLERSEAEQILKESEAMLYSE